MNSTFVLCILFISVSGTSDSISKIFRKCCPKNESLLKTSSLAITENDTYECIVSDRNFSDFKIANPNSNLVLNPNIVVKYGVPVDCNLQDTAFDEKFSTSENICYDRVIIVRNNDTIDIDKPQTVALKCSKSEIEYDTELKIQNVKKCCASGKVYDANYHTCRDSRESSNEEWILRRLKQNISDIYVFQNGMDCYENEYAVELHEGVFEFTLNGYFLNVLNKSGGDEKFFDKGYWCIDQEYTSRKLVARVCTENCTEFGAYCLRKCCFVGQHLERCGTKKSTCVQNTDDSILFNISSYMEPLRAEIGIIDVIGLRTEISCPDTKTQQLILNSSMDTGKHSLDEKGWLKSYYSHSDDYCLESMDSCNGNTEVIAIVCITESVIDSNLSFVLICVTVVCLIITIVVYCSKSRLRNLHGLTLICYLSTMLLGYICLGRAHYGFVSNVQFCTAIGYGKYFGFASAFVWLNVMCFDIWWKMSHIVQSNKKSIIKKFLLYSTYAWGLSGTLTLLTFLLDIYPVSKILDAEMGKGYCWFGATLNTEDDWPHYILFVTPMGIISCVNLVLWLLTAVHCVRVKSAAQRLHAGRENETIMKTYKMYKDNFLLTGKLWIVMGSSWFVEFISTLVTNPDGSTPVFMTVMDRYNELQGLWIFLILVFKPKETYKYIRQKCGFIKSEEKTKNTTTSSVTCSSNISMNSVQSTIIDEKSTANLPSTGKKEE